MTKISLSLYRPPEGENWAAHPDKVLEMEWGEFAAWLENFYQATRATVKSNMPLLSPAVTGGKRRSIENTVYCGCLVFDYDKGNMSPQLPLQRFKDTAIIVYSSFSSTADAPRFRVILPISRYINTDEYRGIADYLLTTKFPDRPYERAWDRCSLNPACLYYLPSTKEQSFFFRRDGAPIDIETVLKKVNALAQARAIREKLKTSTRAPASEQPISQDDATKALLKISPDCSRDLWFRVLCAVHTEFGEHGGRSLAENWSRGSPKYKARDFNTTWKSIGKGKPRNKITIRTLFHIAAGGAV